jgi:dynein assembly factor with WDR repeat domains 1
MKLKRFLLRYYPPGIILEYEQAGETRSKCIDLLDLRPESDVAELVREICSREPLIPARKAGQLAELIRKLQGKLREPQERQFQLFKEVRTHLLPLTNIAINKSGSCFITGSYDRTCKVWGGESGEELLSLEGHQNVVYAVAFNNPFGSAPLLAALIG